VSNMTEETQSQSDNSAEKRGTIINAIKDLRKLLMKETENFKAKSGDNLSKALKSSNEVRDRLKTDFNTIIASMDQYNDNQLSSLKESLEGQLESLRGYTDQLVTTEESRLVNSLEASLTNVKDVAIAQNEGLQELYTEVNSIAKKSIDRSVDIATERNNAVKDDISEKLQLNKEVLVSDITNLRDSFQDEIHTKIENVYMGVSNTKHMIDGIISDTLSRLQENLNRLTEGIDSNFTKEVGEAQDLIHDYEGKLIEAIEKSQDTYQQQVQVILTKHEEATNTSLQVMKNELNKFKAELMDEIVALNSSQAQLFDNATTELESQIEESRASVIDSHGTLRDELEKLVVANKESIAETLEKMKSKSANHIENMENEVGDKVSSASSNFSESVSQTKDLINESVENLKDHIKQGASRTEKIVNDE